MKTPSKQLVMGLLAVGAIVISAPLIAAFEAHVINVTAQIEESCITLVDEITFGTVFPQEKLDKEFDIDLSASFLDASDMDALDYRIRQQPKCWNGNEADPTFGRTVAQEDGTFICENEGFEILPLLCPYLSKTEISEDGTEGENDGEGIPAFHGMPLPWTASTTDETIATGTLAKSVEDLFDTWNIDLKVPCFEGHCAQDWESFVRGVNDAVDPDDYIQPFENEHALFGCDLWVEVTAKRPPVGCEEPIDLMLVIDRSGSINSTELTDLKNAANSFVTALGPSASGTHMGQTSFSTSGTLDLHLTDDESAAHTAINAVTAGGFTNIFAGIALANDELDDAHEHERPEISDVMVIITDGAPNRPFPPATAEAFAAAEADDARATGVEIFVLGVGVTASTENYLKTEIADDAAHYYAVANFGDLEGVLLDLTSCE